MNLVSRFGGWRWGRINACPARRRPAQVKLHLEGLETRALPSVVVAEFPPFTFSSNINGPDQITLGPDGNYWFSHLYGLGRITPAGVATAFDFFLKTTPHGLTTGPDGNLWVAESLADDYVARISPGGQVTAEVHVDHLGGANQILTGPDGNLWFTETSGKVGRIDPHTLQFTLYNTKGHNARDITRGPDNNLWFTDGAYIGRVKTTSAVTIDEFPVVTTNAGPRGIAAVGGFIFFGESGGKIGKVDTAGNLLAKFPLSQNHTPNALVAGPDGNLWYTIYSQNLIGKMTTAGVATEVSGLSGEGEGITLGSDGNLWFTEPFSGGNRIARVVFSAALPTLTNVQGPVKLGVPVTFTAQVAGNNSAFPPPTGTATFYDGATPLSSALSLVNSQATFTTSKLTLGVHGITVHYSGDPTYPPSVSPPVNQVIHNGSIFAVGSSDGRVQVRRTTDGSLVTEFAPYGSAYFGPVTVAIGDITGDGYDDLVTAAKAGNPDVRVYDGKALATGTFNPANPNASQLAQWFPYALQFNVGANVAVGDVNGDGFADVITGATVGNPDVRVYNGKDIANRTFNPNGSSLLAQWFAYGLNFNVGANVAAGDINGDGDAEIVTGATAGNPHVKVYNGKAIATGTFNSANPDASLLAQVFPFALQFNVGAFVAVGDVNGDGSADLITGSSIGNPEVRVYSGKAIANGTLDPANPDASLVDHFFAYDVGANIGAAVGAADFESDGKFDILTGPTSGPPTYRVLRGTATGVKPPAVFEGTVPGFPEGLSVGA